MLGICNYVSPSQEIFRSKFWLIIQFDDKINHAEYFFHLVDSDVLARVKLYHFQCKPWVAIITVVLFCAERNNANARF